MDAENPMSWNMKARKHRILQCHVQALAHGMRRLATSSKGAIVRVWATAHLKILQ